MQRKIVSIVIAAALVAAAPAFAQRASLGERIAALEQQAANNQGNVDLLNQVTQLKNEVQALRAQLEDMQQQQEQARATSRSQFLDLDGRVERLEGAPPAAASSATAAPRAAGTASAPAARPAAATAAAAAPAVREQGPSIHGDAGTLAKGAGERAAYDAAFDALKRGDYAGSAQQFEGFLQAYPSGSYAPNALYWLGESHYVQGRYAPAREQFQALLERYPTHDKAPGAMLKVGLAQYGEQQLDAAERTLGEVVSRYPGTDAARTADDRLRAIQISRAR